MTNAFVVTLDVDWVQDFVLDAVAEELLSRNVRATWFVTHDSPGVRRLQEHGELFEFGLHPNFLPDSTQGRDEREVLSNLRSILPNSRIMRSHGLVQSTPLLSMAVDEFRVDTDVSLFLPDVAHLRPHNLRLNHDGRTLLRIPYFWEDDVATFDPDCSWDITHKKFDVPGLKVFDFHPIHVYLNTDCMARYEQLKRLGPLQDLDAEKVAPLVNRYGPGVGDLFRGLLDNIVARQQRSYKISDIADYWRALA